ncbi:MAG: hypothetical protein R3C10_03810 [Pirellulales bacterium]
MRVFEPLLSRNALTVCLLTTAVFVTAGFAPVFTPLALAADDPDQSVVVVEEEVVEEEFVVDADAAPRPVAVFTFSGWQELIDDLNFVGDVSDSPGLGSSIEGLMALSTGGQGLVGLRRDQPWGVTVSIVNNEPDILAFVPLKDLDRFFKALAGMIGPVPQDENGVYELEVPGQVLFAKQEGEWAFLATRPESLENLPQDPALLVASLTKKYDVAFAVNMQSVPDEFRMVALTQIRLGLEQGMTREKGESDEAFQARVEAASKQVAEIEKALTQIDQLTVGWSINREDRKAYVDVMATAVAGTEMAGEFADIAEGTTSFAGFESPDATVSTVCTGPIAASDREQLPGMLSSSREQLDTMFQSSDAFSDPQVKELTRRFVDKLFAALEKMMDTDKFDGGMAVFGKGPFTIIAGGAVSDSAAFETLVEDTLKDVNEEYPNYEGYRRNVAEYKDLRFHTINVPALPDPEMLETAQEVFGEKIDITIAIGEKRVFFGVGPDAIDRIKHVVDLSAEAGEVAIPPLRMRAKMAPLMGVLGSLARRAGKQMEGEIGKLGGALPGGRGSADEDGAEEFADNDGDQLGGDGRAGSIWDLSARCRCPVSCQTSANCSST